MENTEIEYTNYIKRSQIKDTKSKNMRGWLTISVKTEISDVKPLNPHIRLYLKSTHKVV